MIFALRNALLLSLVLLTACSPSPSKSSVSQALGQEAEIQVKMAGIEPELLELAGRRRVFDGHLALAREDAQRLFENSWGEVQREAVQLQVRQGEIQANWNGVMKRHRETAQRARLANVEWDKARQAWERASAVQVFVLALALGGPDAKLALCSGRQSVRAYRRVLQREGVDLRGMDIDHLLPKSLGGTDHPLNFRPTPAHLNRAWGNRFDFLKCGHQPFACMLGVFVSVYCGQRAKP